MLNFQKESGSFGAFAGAIAYWFTGGNINDIVIVYGFLTISVISTFLVVSSLSRFVLNMRKYRAVFHGEHAAQETLLTHYQS
jgi:hypothetical protein